MSTEEQPELVHWIGEHNNTLHGNGYGSPGMTRGSGDEDEVTCKLCHTLLAAKAREDAELQLPTRRDIRELEELQARIPRPTVDVHRGRAAASHIQQGGVLAGRPLRAGEVVVDLTAKPPAIDEGERWPAVSWHQPRTVGEAIPAGAELEVRADGRIYAAMPLEELVAQLTDLAASAIAMEQVDHALDDVAADDPPPDLDFAEAVAGMANRLLQPAGLALEVHMACTGCGCSENRACDPPCSWIQGQPPRCSACGPVDQEPA